MTKAQMQERAEALERLREWVKPGDTIYTILRHVSASGMTRVIDMLAILPDGTIRHLGYNAAIACGDPYDRKREGVKASGGGMDMGFALVYNLGRVLFPDGFTLPDGKRGRNGDTSGHDGDGGYALSHHWL